MVGNSGVGSSQSEARADALCGNGGAVSRDPFVEDLFGTSSLPVPTLSHSESGNTESYGMHTEPWMPRLSAGLIRLGVPYTKERGPCSHFLRDPRR